MNRHFVMLYLYVKKGSPCKPGAHVPELGFRADYVVVDNGDAVGVFRAFNGTARKFFESQDGVTVLPPLHRPIKKVHADAFAHVDCKEGEIAYDVAERLFEHHSAKHQADSGSSSEIFWLHPESLDA